MMPQGLHPRCAARIDGGAVPARCLLRGAVSVPAAPPSRGQPQEGATITPNYKDADLSQIIQAVGEVTGKNFIIDPRVNAKVTMLSSTPMSPAAFYEAFLSVLQVYGYVAVPAGKVIKIIPNTDARQLPSIDLPNSVSSTSDEIVTQIITMKNISAAQLVPLLRPLDSAAGASRRLSERQHADHLGSGQQREPHHEDRRAHGRKRRRADRCHSAAQCQRDRNGPHHQSAESGRRRGGEAGAAVKVVADERTNSVLISGEKSLKLKAKALDAEPGHSAAGRRRRYRGALSAVRGCGEIGRQAQRPGLGHLQGAGRPGPRPARRAARGGGGGSSNVDASVTIWADVPTNALIMTAPPKIMKNLMAVIDKLDIRRAQVEVEALIVEVAVNKSANLGVQWLLDGGNNLGYGVTNLPGRPAPASSNLAAAAGERL